MALNNLGLGFIFTAKDLASQQMVRLGRSFQSFEKRASKSLTRTQVHLRQFAIGAGIALAGVIALGGALSLAKGAGEFEQEMARVSAISDIATDSQDALMLRTQALDKAMATQFSPKEAAEGLRNFASQGFNAKQQAESLGPALTLAQAGMIPVADAASSMTSALKVFGLETGKAGEVTDKLLKITTKTSLQSEDLTLALGTVGRGAGLAGQGLDEMLISMGLVKNTGVDTSVAASSVSSALIFMGKNADKFSKKIGVSVTDADGNFRDFTDVVLEANDALSNRYPNAAKRAKVATELFGRFGVTAFTAISKQLSNMKDAEGNLLPAQEAIAKLRQEMGDAAGTAEEFEKKILGTFEGQKKLLEGVTEGLAVALGAPLAQAFKPVVTLLKDGIEGVTKFINAIPDDVKNTFAKIAVGLAAAATGIGGLIAVKGAIGLVASAMSFLGVSIATVTGPLLILIGLAATAGLVIAAFAADAEGTTQGALSGITDAFGKMKIFFQGLIQFFQTGELSGPILDELNKAENEGVKSFLGKVISFGFKIVDVFEGVVDGFKSFVKESAPAFAEFKLALGGLGESMGFLTGDVDGTTSGFSDMRDTGVGMGIILAKVAVTIIQGMTLLIKTVGVILTVLDSLGLTIGDVIKLWVAYKVAMLAVKGVQAGIDFVGFIRNFKGVGTAVTATTGKILGMRGALNASKLAGSINGVSGALGKAGLVGAALAAGFAIGTFIDSQTNASGKVDTLIGRVTGLNAELRALDEAAGGRTDVRGAESFSDPKRVQALADQGGFDSIEAFQKATQARNAREGFATEIDETTGLVNITGRIGEGDSAASPVASAAGAGGVARPGGRKEGERALEDASKAIKQASVELNKVSKKVGEPIQVTAVVSDEQVANSRQGNQDRAFAPVPAEG